MMMFCLLMAVIGVIFLLCCFKPCRGYSKEAKAEHEYTTGWYCIIGFALLAVFGGIASAM